MGKIFDINSKFMQIAMKAADLVILNVLTLLCCIPILTIGPAFAAMHYTLLKLYRDEEGGIFKTFFHGFAANFKQGVALTFVYLLFFGILFLDYQFGSRTEGIMRLVLYALPFLALIGGLSLCWVFPLLSRYRNTVFGTIKTTLAATLAHPFKSLMMTALMIAPFLLLLATNLGVPVIATFGLSLCGFLRAMLYDPIFKMLEKAREPEEEEDTDEEPEEEE
jgi:uncharacterized membrane protein YesL